ncbi:MAG: fatty acid desaturase [Gammaproteobacteria bacterium]|nr:fatty acid desaturase [Gammaproteobacteria bacterium]
MAHSFQARRVGGGTLSSGPEKESAMDPKAWLSREELASVMQRSDLKGAFLVASQWLQVIALFWVMAAYPSLPMWILGTLLLGNRLLGFGVLVHECGHRTLFRTPAHHRLAGTVEDPDLPNYRDYPISRDRLWRKLRRDLSGQTGWRTLQGVGRNLSNYSRLSQEARGALGRAVLMNLAVFLALTVAGVPVLYLTWVLAYIFILPLVSRIRQVAEHGAVPDLYSMDARNNTRSVRSNWLMRALFSPHGVNWHLEHHLMPSVPIYNLGRLHRLLTLKGAYDGMRFETNYFHLLAAVSPR